MQTSAQDLPPPPPTSERPVYRVLYKSQAINMLNDDLLLGIFNYYRLANENIWNVRLGWCKISHICRRWRWLVFESVFHLGIHIICTHGTPIVDTLDHLPPLPLFLEYLDGKGRVSRLGNLKRRVTLAASADDELGIYHALQLRDRVRRIDLRLPTSTLYKYLMLMDKPFSTLEYFSLSFTGDEVSNLTLPKTFLAPNLRHLALLGIRLPKRLRLLSYTTSLLTLKLMNMQASGYVRPQLLVARLQSLTELEELFIGFSIPIPRPSAERLLLGNQGTPVIPNLKDLTFRGVSAYLERLVSQIRAPALERLDITLFNQIAFRLPHLSHFVNTTNQIKFRSTAAVTFFQTTFVILRRRNPGRHRFDAIEGFTLRVMCKPSDWQIDCAAQISSALMPALTGVKELTLDYDTLDPSVFYQTEPQTRSNDVDDITWHELLRSFVGVKELYIDRFLSEELSRALEADEIGFDPGLLPDLQELVSNSIGYNSNDLFRSFIHARRVAGRPVSLRPPSRVTINRLT
jgi:hypothetical protein